MDFEWGPVGAAVSGGFGCIREVIVEVIVIEGDGGVKIRVR